MTLTDTGPLVALINRNDPNHARCVAATQTLPAEPLLTTWPCFTEAMYLLFKAGGYSGQEALWQWRTAGRLVLRDLTKEEIDFMGELMDKYRDLPMDLADSSLVAVADRLRTKTVFSLDKDFHIYRLRDGSALTILP